MYQGLSGGIGQKLFNFLLDGNSLFYTAKCNQLSSRNIENILTLSLEHCELKPVSVASIAAA